jgi:hypothetical protein
MSPDDAAAVAAANRLADQVEVLANAVRDAAETIAAAIREVPAAHRMTGQGALD